VELEPFGIDVVIVRPAGILTEWNTISRENLVETSRGGAYEERAERAARTLERADNRLMSSPPKVVGRTILKAATASRPRPRYASGKGARIVPGVRRLLPDRAFDAVVGRVFS
jgi:NAD(P)-dependent dehydrogenase (short-subunit alcohol dehydrogenase family)